MTSRLCSTLEPTKSSNTASPCNLVLWFVCAVIDLERLPVPLGWVWRDRRFQLLGLGAVTDGKKLPSIRHNTVHGQMDGPRERATMHSFERWLRSNSDKIAELIYLVGANRVGIGQVWFNNYVNEVIFPLQPNSHDLPSGLECISWVRHIFTAFAKQQALPDLRRFPAAANLLSNAAPCAP